MKSSIFISTNLNPSTGGGNVSSKELEMLQKNTNVKAILTNRKDLQYPIPVKSINPHDYNLPESPFLWDYLAQEYVEEITATENVDILFINGNAFGRTVEQFYLAQGFGDKTQVIVDVPAHDLQESISEHEKFGVDYKLQYPHNVDEFLMDMQQYHIMQATDLIVPSHLSIEALKKLDLIDVQNVHVIPHGVDIPEKVLPFPEEFRVGYAGAMGFDKGVFYLIQAWQNLAYKDAVLAYAGSHKITWDDPGLGSDGQKKGWIYRIPPFKGAKYKIFGWLPDLHKDFYPHISLYVQPSVTEGFGLEVLEAMSHGRPVICSDGAGASEIVQDNNCGFVFEKRNIKQLTEHIQYFKDNPSELKKYGDRARSASLKYAWNEIIRQYEKVIE